MVRTQQMTGYIEFKMAAKKQNKRQSSISVHSRPQVLRLRSSPTELWFPFKDIRWTEIIAKEISSKRELNSNRKWFSHVSL